MIRRWATSRSVRLVVALATTVSLLAALALAVWVDGDELFAGIRRGAGDPIGVVIIVASLSAAFTMRALAWCRILPGLTFGQSLAGIHLALGANHVLPFRMGEPFRVASVVRRTDVGLAEASSTTVLLRAADVVALAVLGMVVAPRLVVDEIGGHGAALVTIVGLVGLVAALIVVSQRRGSTTSSRTSSPRQPGTSALALVVAAWLAEAVVVWRIAQWFDVALAPREAIAVLAAAVVVQVVAVTPGGVGTYEAAGSAALVAVGVPASTAIATIIVIHAVKTLYSVVAGAVALFVPDPSMLGRLRLDRSPALRPAGIVGDGPVVLFLPAHNEAERIAPVIAAAPRSVDGRRVEVVVVDDASTDDTVAVARSSGATVIEHTHNKGLGAAVRTGFGYARQRGAVAAAFCDADGEYDPTELPSVVGPILRGEAHYVVGSRFAGEIRRMLPHRRLGNLTLTRGVRHVTRTAVTDGQSGYRALSAAALDEVEIVHDYNYAQVLTIDLIAKGFGYHEVPITYEFRRSGRSFVRLNTYLRRVLPAVWRQLNPPIPSVNHAPTENPQCTPAPGFV